MAITYQASGNKYNNGVNNKGWVTYSSKDPLTGSAALDSQRTGEINQAFARSLQDQTQYSPYRDYGLDLSHFGSKANGDTGSGGAGGSKTGNNSAYLASLYGSYINNKNQALNDSYNRTVGNIDNAFGTSKGYLDSNYNAARDAMNSSYNNSLTNLKNDAGQSLREAYVNRILSEKNLGQKMAAQGLSGGATETTLANMNNNYGNSRNNINTTLNRNISDLSANRDQQMAAILQEYNSNLANLVQQRANALANAEQAYQNGQMDLLDKQFEFQTSGNYTQALQDALNNMNAQTFEQTIATNPVVSADTTQVGLDNVTNSTNYAEELLKQLLAQYGADNVQQILAAYNS